MSALYHIAVFTIWSKTTQGIGDAPAVACVINLRGRFSEELFRIIAGDHTVCEGLVIHGEVFQIPQESNSPQYIITTMQKRFPDGMLVVVIDDDAHSAVGHSHTMTVLDHIPEPRELSQMVIDAGLAHLRAEGAEITPSPSIQG